MLLLFLLLLVGASSFEENVVIETTNEESIEKTAVETDDDFPFNDQTVVVDPLSILLGSRAAVSFKPDRDLQDAEDRALAPGGKKKTIFGLKTILIRYFFMPIKKTIAFLFEEVDHDTHFVMKKGVKENPKVEKTFKCLPSNYSSTVPHYLPESEFVAEMNSSAGCGVVLFYTPYCRFSMELLPAYNALARLFPQLILLAVEINSYSSSCIHFGAVGTPTLMFYHSSRPLRKVPARNLTSLVDYVHNITDLEVSGKVELIEDDYKNVELLYSFDWVLLFCVIFLVLSLFYNLSKTRYGRLFLEKVFKMKRD